MNLNKYINCILHKLSKKKKKVQLISDGDTSILIKYLVCKLSKKKILNSDIKQFKIVLKINDIYFFKQLKIKNKKINPKNFDMLKCGISPMINTTQLNSKSSVSVSSSKYIYDFYYFYCEPIFYFHMCDENGNLIIDSSHTDYNPSNNTLISTDYRGNIYLYDRDNNKAVDSQYMLRASGYLSYQLYKTITNYITFGITGNYLFSTDIYDNENIYNTYNGIFTISLKNSDIDKFNTTIYKLTGFPTFISNSMADTTFANKASIITYVYENIKATTGFDMRKYFPLIKSTSLNSVATSCLPNMEDGYNGNNFITTGDYDNTGNNLTNYTKTANTTDYRGTAGYYGVDINNVYNLYTYGIFKLEGDTKNVLYFTSKNNKASSQDKFPRKVSFYDLNGDPYNFEDDYSNNGSIEVECEIKAISQYSTENAKCNLYLFLEVYYVSADWIYNYVYKIEPYTNAHEKVKIISIGQMTSENYPFAFDKNIISVSCESIVSSYGANLHNYILLKSDGDQYTNYTEYKALYYANMNLY